MKLPPQKPELVKLKLPLKKSKEPNWPLWDYLNFFNHTPQWMINAMRR
jgi:hypothetical protein